MLVKSILMWLSLSIALRAETGVSDLFVKAVSDGNLNMIETLLASGFNPDEPVHGYIPLYFAVQQDRADVIRLLLAAHADPNALIASGEGVGRAHWTALQIAAQIGNVPAAAALIAGGARVDEKDSKGWTALHYAVADGHLEAIQLLIRRGADPNVRDAEGASPLDDAVWHGSVDAVALLLAHGAHIDEPDTGTGATPINEAAFLGDAALVRYLLQFRPDLELRDKRGYGPLGNAIKMGKEKCSLLLLDAEPRERLTSDFLEGALEAAIPKDESVLVGDLLRRGAAANGLLSSGASPLDLAASTGAAKVTRLLLENGADANAGSRDGASALADASLRGYAAIAGLLLDHGASVNRVDESSGSTALYAAASFGREDVVTLLLSRGADPNLCGEKGKTAYESASENGFGDVAMMIKNHGGTARCEGAGRR